MNFSDTPISGVWIITPDPVYDERGYFARSFCQKEFLDHGLVMDIVQCNMSFNKKKGTLRGMHFQSTPFEEKKLVSCIKGAIYDVVLDLRENSLTFCQYFSIELGEENCKILYVPEGCAHGFQTLNDNSVVYYQMSEFFHPEYSGGVRWNDPEFAIQWPIEQKILSDKDQSYSDFKQ